MSPLNLNDLDFEAQKEAIEEIRQTRKVLGKMSVRDFTEAVHGTAYTVLMFGEDGGKDVLMEDLNANDEVRSQAGQRRVDAGNNHGVGRPVTAGDRNAAIEALREQETVIEAEMERVYADSPMFGKGAKTTQAPDQADAFAEVFQKLSPDVQKQVLKDLLSKK